MHNTEDTGTHDSITSWLVAILLAEVLAVVGAFLWGIIKSIFKRPRRPAPAKEDMMSTIVYVRGYGRVKD